MPFVFKPGQRRTFLEAADAVSSVTDASADFSDLASNVHIVENENVEEDALWDLMNLTTKEDSRIFALQRFHEPRCIYGLWVHSDVRSV